MRNKKITSLSRKISMTLICILGSAGVIFFFEALKNFNAHKIDEILWATFFGIAFAYFLDYKLEITLRSTSHGKSKKKRDG
jgi:hypothetical protein